MKHQGTRQVPATVIGRAISVPTRSSVKRTGLGINVCGDADLDAATAGVGGCWAG